MDGLERQFADRMRVARVDIETDSGRELAGRFAVSAIPAFVVLDGRGRVVYRQVGGRPDGALIEQRLAAAGAPAH